MDLFDIADKVISQAYPGKPGFWGGQHIPNYGILRGAIVAALQSQRAVANEPPTGQVSPCCIAYAKKCADESSLAHRMMDLDP